MKVKVCGMRDARNIAEIARLGPDFMGFIFYERSPRFAVGLEPAALDVLRDRTKRVGVFVDAAEQYIRETAERYRLDFVQLHGNESPEFCASLRNGDFGVVKAFGIADGSDLIRAKRYEGMCDFYVFDTKTPAHGGSGRQFDHSVLQAYGGTTPYLLSGGIAPDYIPCPQITDDPRFMGFDINSRFETAPGVKDVAAVEKFIKFVRMRDGYYGGV